MSSAHHAGRLGVGIDEYQESVDARHAQSIWYGWARCSRVEAVLRWEPSCVAYAPRTEESCELRSKTPGKTTDEGRPRVDSSGVYRGLTCLLLSEVVIDEQTNSG